MIQEHFAAMKAQLESDTALTVRDTVYESDGTIYQGTYAVLHGGGPEVLEDERATALQSVDSDATYRYSVTCVAANPTGVRYVMDKVFAQFIGFTPTVTGRRCDQVVYDPSSADAIVQADKSVLPVLFYTNPEFILTSHRP